VIYLKSTIAGIAALLLIAVLIPTAVFVAVSIRFRDVGHGSPIWHVHTRSPVFWLAVSFVFAIGFLGEFRRLSH
jgi:hypothetical protein